MLIALPTAAAADELVGRVVSAVGEVIAIRPDEGELALQRRSEIYIGDTLVTGENGRAQIRFVDDGLVDLRPNSELLVENYAEPTEEEGGSAVLEFSRGALRTATGLVGQNPDDEYRMETAPASIGIRGTDYALQYCDAACVDAGGAGGLYGRINDGGITVSNLAGTQDFDSGQFFNVVDQNTLPTSVPRPPAGILDGNEGGENGDDDEDEDNDIEEIGLDEPDDDEDGDEDDAPDLVSQSVDPVSASSTVSVDESDINITRTMVGIFSYRGFEGYGKEFDSAYFGGMIRQLEGSSVLTLNEDGKYIIEAQFGDGTSVSDGKEYGDAVTWAGDANVYWGEWGGSGPNNPREATYILDGEEITFPDSDGTDPNFRYWFSDDLTSVTQMSSLGRITYSSLAGPNDFFSLQSGDSFFYMGDGLVLEVDFASIEAALSMSFHDTLESTFYSVDTGMQSVDSLFLLEMDFTGDWQVIEGPSGALEGTFNGQFVGETADGVLFSFTMEQLLDGNTIDELIGAGLLADETLTVP
ncbi:FecR family protein [Natronospirillum operosum]|uniref:FecR family protein n=1 Tax=Natronospirillum operosum TaxID=2759953 RepID=UPI00197CA4AB|nr:FecR family protein [Natronospirillum operosum]